MRAMLVYQGGLANVYRVDSFNLKNYGRNARLLYQGSFIEAALYAQGMGAGGVKVMTAACNMAGDVSAQPWTDNLESVPFSDELIDVRANLTGIDAGDVRDAAEALIVKARRMEAKSGDAEPQAGDLERLLSFFV